MLLQQRTKIIGLTGGIGSGKTTVAKYFENLGIPVYIADIESRNLMNKQSIVEEIVRIFGNDIILDRHGIDRKKLGDIVFKDKVSLNKLTKIIYPEVEKHFEQWLLKYKDNDFVIKESAVLFESSYYKNCYKTILVVAPEKIRIERVMKRDSLSEIQIKDRIANQWDDEKKLLLSDYVIINEDFDKSKKEAMLIFLDLHKKHK